MAKTKLLPFISVLGLFEAENGTGTSFGAIDLIFIFFEPVLTRETD